MRISRLLPLVLGMLIITTPAASAQDRHVLDRSAIDRAVSQKADAEKADRALVLRTVERPQVLTVAARLGLSAADVRTAVAGLDPTDLAKLAGPARRVDQAYAGGDEIIISTTTFLLLLILIVLILK